MGSEPGRYHIGMANESLPLLVLPPRRYTEQAAVEQVWRQRNWPVAQIARLSDPGNIPSKHAKLYGDYEFCVVVAQALDLRLVSPNDDLLGTLNRRWVGRDIRCLTLEETFSQRFPRFVKPLSPKLFKAGVYKTRQALIRQAQGLLAETRAIVAEPVSFRNEARCLILHGTVTSVGLYEGAGNLEDAHQFAAAFVRENALPATCVLDVGEIEGGGWAVIETNPIWGAGLNGCDPACMADCVVVATQPVE